MKRVFPALLAVFFVFGCKKDHNGLKTDIDPSVPSGRLAGFTIYQAQIPGISLTRSMGIYSLKCDPAGHLSSCLEPRNEAFYLDSLYSTDGDVVRLGYYSPLDTLSGGAIDTTGALFQRATDYSYGQDSNPLYDRFLSGSVGVSVFVLKSFDLFSQHPVVSSHTVYNFYYPVKLDLTYSWTKDASGRVVKGIAVNPDGTSSKAIIFTYAP